MEIYFPDGWTWHITLLINRFAVLERKEYNTKNSNLLDISVDSLLVSSKVSAR